MQNQQGSRTNTKDIVTEIDNEAHESLAKPDALRLKLWKAISGQAERLNRRKRPTEASGTTFASTSTAVSGPIPLTQPPVSPDIANAEKPPSGEDVWTDVVHHFRSQVGEESYMQILFKQSIESLESNYDPSSSETPESNSADQIRPLIEQLKSVSGVASAIAPTCPELGAILWGSVELIAWNTNNSSLTKRVVESLKPIGQDLELFGKFLSMFSESDCLCKATQAYYIKVIELLEYLVMVLQRRKRSAPPMAVVENNLNKQLLNIRELAIQVEREAQAAKFEADETWKNNTQFLEPTRSPSSLKLFDAQPSTKFHGRENYLQELNRILVADYQGGKQGTSLLLHGLGGVGKSELAIKFVSDHESAYPFIIWIAADTIQKVRIAIGKAFRELGLVVDSSGEPSGFVWRNWLAETDGWLLVFDNVEEETVLREFWPRSKNGTIIATSRSPHIASTLMDHDIEVLPMTIDQSIDLLSKLLPIKYQSAVSDEQAKAEEICRLVDGLPLAVVLIASLIREGLRTLGETLEILKKTRAPLLNWSSNSGGSSKDTLTTVWEANIARLPKDSLYLLQIMTFLDPDRVEEAMLMDGRATKLRQVLPLEPSSYLVSLQALSNFSLIRRNGSTLSIHRLVQDVTIQRMDSATRYHMFQIAVDLVWTVFPKQENGLLMSSQLSSCQNYLPHVESLEAKFRDYSLSANPNSGSAQLAEVAYLCSWSMYERGMFSQAINLAVRGIEIAGGLNGDNRLLLADLWTTVGGSQLEDPMMFHDGFDSLEMALKLRKDASEDGLIDPAHPQLANSYMSLGGAATGIGRYRDAVSLGKRSVDLRKDREEEQLQMLAMSHHNIGLAWLALNELEEADTALKKALILIGQSNRSMLPEQQFAMQCRTFYLHGNILLAHGKRLEGKEMHERSLILRMRTMTETHPYTACSFWKLATLWEDEDWTKAVFYYRKAIDTYDRLSLVEAQRGRAIHHLGLLLQRYGLSGSDKYLDIARKIHYSIKREQLLNTAMEPFKMLIHPFYW